MYRIGLSQSEVSEEALAKSGLHYKIVAPRDQMVASARSVIGKPYKRGASVSKDAPNFFECSSLASWAAVEAGYAIPRVSIDQFVFSKRISEEEAKVGDLVFANTEEVIHTEGTYYSQVLNKEVQESAIRYETLEFLPGTKVPHGVDHVGIIVAPGRVVHGSCNKDGVVEEDLKMSSSFQKIVGYGRIIDNEDNRYVVEIPEDKPELRSREALIEYVNQYAN